MLENQQFMDPTIQEKLSKVFGTQQANQIAGELESILNSFKGSSAADEWSEKDILLISYGDQIQSSGRADIQTLHRFLKRHLKGRINGVHLLPFYPYSSDDGFSVIDYWQVDPKKGTWQDIQQLGLDFNLMFDGVINHISAQSDWFQRFLEGDPKYRSFFIAKEEDADLSKVVRPRTTPLLTPFHTSEGLKHIWTTFSSDQIDLNYSHPPVFLKIVELMLFYIEQGAQLIRLDAIPFLWKKEGTNCMHLEETHLIVQILRALLNRVAPGVKIVTEANVPHHENIEYFGDGTNEAQLVYQFPLAPLLVHAINFGSSRHLNQWADSLKTPSKETAFFNLTASHDGIGVRPVENIISADEMEQLSEQVQKKGGLISWRTAQGKERVAYEWNITFFEAIRDPELQVEDELNNGRFLTSQAIAMSLAGIPGIYIHNLFGSLNWNEGVKTGSARSINRKKFIEQELEDLLHDPTSRESGIFEAYLHLLGVRTREKSFHPNGAQRIIECGDSIFGLLRTSPDRHEQIIALHNLTKLPQSIHADLQGLVESNAGTARDLLSGEEYLIRQGALSLAMPPFATIWIKVNRGTL
ncbi:MAG: sugar phosphorylase [SAR324 cluster bacterium]|nr:sugar phosphorylase [SAR324 cluster bacterium]